MGMEHIISGSKGKYRKTISRGVVIWGRDSLHSGYEPLKSPCYIGRQKSLPVACISLELPRVEVDKVQQPRHSWPCFHPHSKYAGSAVSFPSVYNAPASCGLGSSTYIPTPWNYFSSLFLLYFLSFIIFNLFLGSSHYSAPIRLSDMSPSHSPSLFCKRMSTPFSLCCKASSFPGVSSLSRVR